MKSVGPTRACAIEDDRALVDVEPPQQAPGEHDLFVKVHAVSVNPVGCTIGAINAATLTQTHRLIESGTAVGTFALQGFTAQP